MVRTQLQLTEAQVRALKHRAAEEGVSVAELVRRAVDKSLQEVMSDPDELRKRALSAAGRFRSGEDDALLRHDDYLAEAYGQ